MVKGFEAASPDRWDDARLECQERLRTVVKPPRASTSVIIPTYNLEAIVADAIQSALGQTVAPDEVIVSDDGSTDGTVEVARSLGVTVLQGPKANGNVARNRGIRHASGDIVFLLDGDDWWHPLKIETHLLAHAAQPRASFVYDPSVVVERGSLSERLIGDYGELHPGWSHFLDWRAWASGSCFSLRRQIVEGHDAFDERLIALQDVDFWVRTAHRCGSATRLEAPYTYYRIMPRSVSRAPRNVAANLDNVLANWPFLSESQRVAFRRQTFLTAARFSGLKNGIGYLGLAGWPIGTAKFWKAFGRMAANSVRGAWHK